LDNLEAAIAAAKNNWGELDERDDNSYGRLAKHFYLVDEPVDHGN